MNYEGSFAYYIIELEGFNRGANPVSSLGYRIDNRSNFTEFGGYDFQLSRNPL